MESRSTELTTLLELDSFIGKVGVVYVMTLLLVTVMVIPSESAVVVTACVDVTVAVLLVLVVVSCSPIVAVAVLLFVSATPPCRVNLLTSVRTRTVLEVCLPTCVLK